ncbi:MAG: hypothetical protein IKR81_09635 [Victivallales bacterium]|jgi:hypothetical protein|nr:hypothetical protein [Victivallales bacterium]
MNDATIENGFATVGKGSWLVGAMQPTAVLGNCVPRSLKGWIVPDRANLHIADVEGTARCGMANRPFLTQITCAAPVTAVSAKLLVAPAAARKGGRMLRVIPFSFRNAICVTECETEWVVMATQSRTMRLSLEEEQMLTLRVESAVAWTTKPPTGFCPRISVWDILIPKRRERELVLHFYGPGIVWMEGSNAS